MNNQEKPEYISTPSLKSFGNAYRIYKDRIELEARFLFRKFVINKDDIVFIKVFIPPVFRTKFWALKLDFADLKEHVGIKRKTGFMKNLRFTPNNPKEFVEKVNEILLGKDPEIK